MNMKDYPSLHLYTNYSKWKDTDVNEHERLSVITLMVIFTYLLLRDHTIVRLFEKFMFENRCLFDKELTVKFTKLKTVREVQCLSHPSSSYRSLPVLHNSQKKHLNVVKEQLVVRKDIDVDEHERLSVITLIHKL
jgi:hypothetical protein